RLLVLPARWPARRRHDDARVLRRRDAHAVPGTVRAGVRLRRLQPRGGVLRRGRPRRMADGPGTPPDPPGPGAASGADRAGIAARRADPDRRPAASPPAARDVLPPR